MSSMHFQELHSQKGYGFVHFAYSPEGVAAAVKCCDELHDSTVDQVQYKCSISHRLRQCMNGGVSEEPQHAHHYHNHHHNHHNAQRHQPHNVTEQYSEFGYLPTVNPLTMPAAAYPVQYGYNQASMIVPMNVSMDSFQYAQNPYWSQMMNNSTYTSVQAGQPMPFAYCSPFAQQYPSVVNPPYYMQQSNQYYNEQAPAGVYTMPYTWGYPYSNSTEEEENEAEVYTHTHSDVSYSVYPQSEHFQHQSFAHAEPPHAAQLPPAVTSPTAPVSLPAATAASANSPTSASPTGVPNVVTGFGAQHRPTASEMAAAVHGGATFTYIPCGVPAPAGLPYQSGSQHVSNSGSTQPPGLQEQHSYHQYEHMQQHQNHQNHLQQSQSQCHGQQLQQSSTTTPSSNKDAENRQQQKSQRINPYAPRPKTWTDLFQAAVKEAHKQPAPAGVAAAPVPPVVVPVLPLHRPVVSPPPAMVKQVPSNKRPYAGPVHNKNNQQQQQQQHQNRQFQRGAIVKSASTGSLSGSVSGSSNGSSTGSFPAHRTSGTTAGSLAKSDSVGRGKDLPVMVVGTGTSTGHSILVSSLRTHRDYKSFARNVNLCAVVPRQRGPAVTPRSAQCTATSVAPDGIASCGGTNTEKHSTDKLSAPEATTGTILDGSGGPIGSTIVSTTVMAPDAKTALSPTHEDTALDSVAVRVVSPAKVVPYVARGEEGRVDMM